MVTGTRHCTFETFATAVTSTPRLVFSTCKLAGRLAGDVDDRADQHLAVGYVGACVLPGQCGPHLRRR